jgi:catechol 2,3-dioxygenase-like lactoylglutathione lyase family enzyme
VRVIGFDHIVLNVADVERSLDWYCGVLGLAPERVEEWRRGEVFFPSARVNEHTVIDLLATARSGQNADHFCLVVEPTDLQALVDSGRLEVLEGPVPRWGAQGDAMSIYVRDPDGNTVELRHYG